MIPLTIGNQLCGAPQSGLSVPAPQYCVMRIGPRDPDDRTASMVETEAQGALPCFVPIGQRQA